MSRWSTRPGAGWRAALRALGAIGVLTVPLAGVLPPPAPARAQAPRTITLEAPAPGATVADPVTVSGRVTVSPFENNLVGTVYDAAGQAVGRGPVTVTP